MPPISVCDLNIMYHFETASMTVDSAGERHMAGLAEISLKDGNELGSHMWHSLCNLCIQLWSLPCSKDLRRGFSPRLRALACSGTGSGM